MILSAIIIAKNEEEQIEGSIKSVSFADEILVIDAESSDNTIQIAKRAGARVIQHKQENFSKQRLFAKTKAKGKWILYIDADERVTKNLAKEIASVVKNNRHAAYRIPRVNYYLGNHKFPQAELMERLFLKSQLVTWQGAIHESAQVDGSIGNLTNSLVHYTHRDLSSMIEKTLTWADHDVEKMLAIHHPPMTWYRFISVMTRKFFTSYISKGGWKMGTAGIVESIYQSYSYFIIYAILWEKQQQNQNKK